jgi:8-oxo-dGTP pyrophosphatase MutT (NUDIX family)
VIAATSYGPVRAAARWLARRCAPAVVRVADRGSVLIKDRLSSRHVVTSAYVVCGDKVLLIHHRGLNRWLAPGGHMSFGETPDECAAREVLEETGLCVDIVDGESGERFYREAGVTILHRPLAVQLEVIGENHEHIDLVYAAVASEDEVVPESREIIDFRWFNSDDLAAAALDENVKVYASRALVLARLHNQSSDS